MKESSITLLSDFSDRLSPMVVKELRHGLRTRVFTSVLTSFQLCMILIVGVGVLGVEAEVISNIFWSIALLALLLALPVRGFAALSGEAQGGTMDMLTLSSISSFRIVFGKWSALFSQSLLLGVSLLPYMVARYYFGGVEILREFVAMVVVLLGSALASAAFVAFSSQRSLVLRLFLTAGIVMALIPVTIFTFVMINQSGGDEMLREFLSLRSFEQLGIIAGPIIFVTYAIFTLLTLGASRIAPVSENHSTRKRLVHLVVMSLITLAGWALCLHSNAEAALFIIVPALGLTALIGMDLLTEEMPRFPSVVQELMKSGGLIQRIRFILYPGWASGVFLYVLLCSMSGSILLGNMLRHRWYDLGEPFSYVFFCGLVTVIVPLFFSFNKSNRFANWWVVNIGLGVAGMFLMMLMNISRGPELGFMGVITPLTTLFAAPESGRYDEDVLLTGAIFNLCWLGAALIVAKRECVVYSQLEAKSEKLSTPPSIPS